MEKLKQLMAYKKIILSLSVVLIIIVSIASIANYIYYNSVIPISELRKCEANEDCVLVKCDNGRNVMIVNKKYIAYWTEKFGGINISPGTSCEFRVECIEESCTGSIGREHD